MNMNGALLVTEAEMDSAIIAYCKMAPGRPVPKAFRNRPDCYFQSIHALREVNNRDRGRQKLAWWLIRKYRKENDAGKDIDWETFEDWLGESIDGINEERFVVSILMLMLLI